MQAAGVVVAGLVLTFGSLLLAACNNNTTEPDRTLLFSGNLARSGTKIDSVEFRHTGNLRLTVLDLQQVAADGTMSAPLFRVPIGLGNPATGGTCTITSSYGVIKDEIVSVGLEKGTYCLQITEPTLVPEGASLNYQYRVEITD
jgi:hypothetical protein